jgi:hypothetical protein
MPNKGYHHSEETKQRQREAMKGRKPSAETVEASRLYNQTHQSNFRGKHHTEEAKEKLRLCNLGKHHEISEETKRKISVALTGRKLSSEHIARTKSGLQRLYQGMTDAERKVRFGGHSLSPEVKSKLRAKAIARCANMTADERAKLGDGNRGKKQTEATKEKREVSLRNYWANHTEVCEQRRQKMLGLYSSPEFRTKMATIARESVTPERNAKISAKLKGRIRPPLELQRASASLKKLYTDNPGKISGTAAPFYGRKHSPETREHLSEIRKVLWRDGGYRDRTMDSILAGRRASSPYDSQLEKELAEALVKVGLCFTYQVRINHLSYDFEVFEDGSNLYVEIAGCYWHGCPMCFKVFKDLQIRGYRKLMEKADAFSNVLVLWEHDIRANGYDWCIAQIKERLDGVMLDCPIEEVQ